MDATKIQIVIGVLAIVYFVIPELSERWDTWMANTQNEMIENQTKLDQKRTHHVGGPTPTRVAARGQLCDSYFESAACRDPDSLTSLETCLTMLRKERCDELTGINLCVVVEYMSVCQRPPSAQMRATCDRLRHAAACAERPASVAKRDESDHNWTIGNP